MKKKNEPGQIELRSKKVRKIIGKIPPGIIRYGNTIIFLVFLVLIAFGFFFKYSSVINSPCTLYEMKGEITGHLKINPQKTLFIDTTKAIMLTFSFSPRISKRAKAHIKSISKKTYVKDQRAYKKAYFNVLSPNKFTNELIIKDSVEIKTSFSSQPMSFFERLNKKAF